MLLAWKYSIRKNNNQLLWYFLMSYFIPVVPNLPGYPWNWNHLDLWPFTTGYGLSADVSSEIWLFSFFYILSYLKERLGWVKIQSISQEKKRIISLSNFSFLSLYSPGVLSDLLWDPLGRLETTDLFPLIPSKLQSFYRHNEQCLYLKVIILTLTCSLLVSLNISANRAENHNNKGSSCFFFKSTVKVNSKFKMKDISDYLLTYFSFSKSRIRCQKAHNWRAFAWICCLKYLRNWASSTKCSWWKTVHTADRMRAGTGMGWLERWWEAWVHENWHLEGWAGCKTNLQKLELPSWHLWITTDAK